MLTFIIDSLLVMFYVISQKKLSEEIHILRFAAFIFFHVKIYRYQCS